MAAQPRASSRLLSSLFAVAAVALVGCGAPDGAPAPGGGSFGFHVDPEQGTVIPSAPDGPNAPTATFLPSDTRILVPGVDVALVDLRFRFVPQDDKLIVSARLKNITPRTTFLQPLFFTLKADARDVVRATAPLVTDAQLGGDGALRPGEATAPLRFEVIHRNRPFSFFVDASAVPSGTTGALRVAMSGLPGPWRDGGHVVLEGPAGFRKALFASTTLTELAAGRYTVTVNPLEICRTAFAGSRARFTVEVEAGRTSTARIRYAPSPSTQGFRAGISGGHSEGGLALGDLSFVLEGRHLELFGCLEVRVFGPVDEIGSLEEVDVLEGDHWNHFLDPPAGPAFALRSTRPRRCTQGDPVASCVFYLFGSRSLTPHQVRALEAGRYFSRARPPGFTDAVSQILPDGRTVAGTGGVLEVSFDFSGLPASLRSGAALCVAGVFDNVFTATLRDDPKSCVIGELEFTADTREIGYTLDGERRVLCSERPAATGVRRWRCADLYSGAYEAAAKVVQDTSGDPPVTYAAILESDPAEVRPGVTKTLRVVGYVPAGVLAVALAGLPPDALPVLVTVDGPSGRYTRGTNDVIDGALPEEHLAPGRYAVTAGCVVTSSGETHAGTVTPSPAEVVASETTTVLIEYAPAPCRVAAGAP